MKCTKCNHPLPDDSVFCQYCGNRLEKTAVTPDAAKPFGAAMSTRSTDQVTRPLPNAASRKPEEAPIAKGGFRTQAAGATIHIDSHSQSNRSGETGVGFAPEKAPETKKVKQPKKRYCSRCGSLIDAQTKQCTGCGKQYFKGMKMHKVAVTITLLTLAIVALIGLNVFQYLSDVQGNQELHQKSIALESLEAEMEVLEQKNADLEKEVSELKVELHEQQTVLLRTERMCERAEAEMDAYEPLIEFCKDHVEIVGNDGTNYYHKFGCQYLDLSYGFIVLNTEVAIIEGFTRCPHCLYTQNLVQ